MPAHLFIRCCDMLLYADMLNYISFIYETKLNTYVHNTYVYSLSSQECWKRGNLKPNTVGFSWIHEVEYHCFV